MVLSWIIINPRLETGVGLINSITTSKFQLLLQHTIQSKNETVFTAEELEKLERSLGLTANNLQLLIQSIVYIFKESSKVILKPTVLQKQFVEDLKFDADKAEEFVKIWTNVTKQDFENFENRLKLENVSWELNMQTASSENAKHAIPNVRVKLGLSGISSLEKRNVIFELNEDELLQMYNTLESIQNKLDIITK